MTLSHDPDPDLQTPDTSSEGVPAATEDPRLSPLGPPPKVLSPVFWLMIAIGVVCVLAGLAVALVGPKLYPHNEPPIATVPR